MSNSEICGKRVKTILKNGTAVDMPPYYDEFEDFFVQRIEEAAVCDKYNYPGDEIKYEIDGELVRLYDTFMYCIFETAEQYYSEVVSLPIWIQEAGQNSDCKISSDEFADDISKTDIPDLNKHLYLVDWQFLVGTIQNLMTSLEDNFVGFYYALSECDNNRIQRFSAGSGTMIMASENARIAASKIETYFTKAYSILDVLCKILYELQHIQVDFSSYNKIKSAHILWGANKKLHWEEKAGSVFEKCDTVNTILAIRNEIVHNGTWELNPKIYYKIQNGEVVERYMLFPDFEQGHLAAVQSRKHFFSSRIKVNDALPKIHQDFTRRILNTIRMINEQYR